MNVDEASQPPRPKMIYSQSYADGLTQHQHNTEVMGGLIEPFYA